MRVAVLGAGGTMGFAMARNLARGGMSVTAWNRSPGKVAPLSGDGVQVADSPAQAAAAADVVLTMLSDADAVLAAMDGELGAAAAMTPSAIWAQMSTVGEDGTDRCARLAAGHGLTFVDSPVLGTKQPAEQGSLVVLGSGPEQARARLQPVFDIIGRKTIWVGEAGGGTKLKLVANSWVLAVVEAGAETIALAKGLGVRPGLLFEALQGGPLDLPYFRMKGAVIVARDFDDAAFQLSLAAKDAGLIEQAAQRRELDLPVLYTVRKRLDEGARSHGHRDFSATYLTSARGSPVAHRPAADG
jgi:3-hydroxyisobutyrate dehydrogenase